MSPDPVYDVGQYVRVKIFDEYHRFLRLERVAVREKHPTKDGWMYEVIWNDRKTREFEEKDIYLDFKED